MKKSSSLIGFLLLSLVACSSHQPKKVAEVSQVEDGAGRTIAQYPAPTSQCPIPQGYVLESTVVSKVNQDLNLTVRSQRPVEGFGSGQRNCLQNVLSTPMAQSLVEECNARAFYIKRCSMVALPGATFGPLTAMTQTFQGTAHKRNCGNTPDNIACGRPLCEQDLNRNIANYQNTCQSTYNARCDVVPNGAVIHSFNDGRFRCSQSVSLTPYIPEGVSCRVMLEAKNADADGPRQ